MLPLKPEVVADVAASASRLCPGERRSFFCRIKCRAPAEPAAAPPLKEEADAEPRAKSAERKYCVVQCTGKARAAGGRSPARGPECSPHVCCRVREGVGAGGAVRGRGRRREGRGAQPVVPGGGGARAARRRARAARRAALAPAAVHGAPRHRRQVRLRGPEASAPPPTTTRPVHDMARDKTGKPQTIKCLNYCISTGYYLILFSMIAIIYHIFNVNRRSIAAAVQKFEV